jgi:hypothetical protein
MKSPKKAREAEGETSQKEGAAPKTTASLSDDRHEASSQAGLCVWDREPAGH